MPFYKMWWPKTILSFTMKWHFSQYSTKLQSSHLLRTSDKLVKHRSNESPTTEKSSIKTSIVSSTMSENIYIIHLWKVAGALHNTNGILLNAKVPYGQVKVVFSWSSGAIEIWLYPEYPSRKQYHPFSASLSNIWFMKGIGKWSFSVHEFSLR